MTIKCEKLLAIEIDHKLNFSVHVDDICKKAGQKLRVFFLSTILVIIFWNFTMFQYKSDSPHVKQILISSTKKLGIRVASRVAKRLKTQDISKYYEILKFG